MNDVKDFVGNYMENREEFEEPRRRVVMEDIQQNFFLGLYIDEETNTVEMTMRDAIRDKLAYEDFLQIKGHMQEILNLIVKNYSNK